MATVFLQSVNFGLDWFAFLPKITSLQNHNLNRKWSYYVKFLQYLNLLLFGYSFADTDDWQYGESGINGDYTLTKITDIFCSFASEMTNFCFQIQGM